MNKEAKQSRYRPGRLAVAIMACAGLVACTTIVLRQGWDRSYGAVVPHDSFPSDCSLCHISGSWSKIKKEVSFDHAVDGHVELFGAHKGAQCLLCHNDRGHVTEFSSQGCAGCHVDVHQGKMGRLCNDCHGEQTWFPKDAIAQHNRTRFPLIGAHAGAVCFACHEGASVNNFKGLDTRCETCHSDDITRSLTTDHQAQGWTQGCDRCHQQTAWLPASFDHPSSFPLSASHNGLDCSACHVGNVFTGLNTDCVSCHITNYQETTNPNHMVSGFSTDCTSCHSTNAWKGAFFNHPFPLTASHGGLDCTACHAGGIFSGLSSDCVSCHLTDFQGTTNPNHVASGFSNDCTSCHGTTTWKGAVFNHPFPLTASHGALDCTACHSGGIFTGLSSECVSCHLTNFQGTTNPNHTASGFSTDCASCHGTSTWQGATINHPFPLTAGHSGLDCTSCHSGGIFTGLSSDCVSCHITDFQGTTNPSHVASGFSTDCTSCHSTTTWQGAVFNHTFPLSGGHGGLNCASCHSGGIFTGLSSDCVSCHLTDFQTTTDPNHVAANFSTDCTSCHGTTTWQGAVFNHRFPRNGPHNLDCTSCHLNPASFIDFNCTNCHEHRQTKMDDKHKDEPGYVWLSTACVNCHPNGKK